jgi:hypothetical protein
MLFATCLMRVTVLVLRSLFTIVPEGRDDCNGIAIPLPMIFTSLASELQHVGLPFRDPQGTRPQRRRPRLSRWDEGDLLVVRWAMVSIGLSPKE